MSAAQAFAQPSAPQQAFAGLEEQQSVGGYPTAFKQWLDDNEMPADIANDIFQVLMSTRVVLLLDDSGSMTTKVIPPGMSAMTATAAMTRWAELERLTATLVDMISAATSGGLDVHFLNRPSFLGVNCKEALAPAFQDRPKGGTPLCSAIPRVLSHYEAVCAQSRVLLIIITDGEPSDGSADDLFYVLQRELRRPNLHVSMCECNDNEEEMAYLDTFDNRLPRFDNNDDYGMEANRVKAAQVAQGKRVRFSYADYSVKVVLGAILRRYFMLDQLGLVPRNRGLGGFFGGPQAIQAAPLFRQPAPQAYPAAPVSPYQGPAYTGQVQGNGYVMYVDQNRSGRGECIRNCTVQ